MKTQDDLKIIRKCTDLLLEHFDFDLVKTKLWINSSNAMFGGVSPKQLFEAGRAHKVLEFINQAIEDNKIE